MSENVFIENTPKKRGRKPKSKTEPLSQDTITETDCKTKEVIHKKRGRKPKGGKIVKEVSNTNIVEKEKSNIILHLKCTMEELLKNKHIKSDFNSFSFQTENNLNLNLIDPNNDDSVNHKACKVDNQLYINVTKPINDDQCLPGHNKTDKENKIIWNKLKELQKSLHNNTIDEKSSACFWCTYDFDSPPIYIPKNFINGTYQVYGCFCSPECGTAYLMKEKIDTSTRFERYYLLNYIYSKIYNYENNIKPAPNPEYILDRFYGNMTIQEYRSLLKNDRLFLLVDKPLTRVMPELHEDNDDFIINNKSIASNNNYQIKKACRKKEKKETLIKTFGFN